MLGKTYQEPELDADKISQLTEITQERVLRMALPTLHEDVRVPIEVLLHS